MSPPCPICFAWSGVGGGLLLRRFRFAALARARHAQPRPRDGDEAVIGNLLSTGQTYPVGAPPHADESFLHSVERFAIYASRSPADVCFVTIACQVVDRGNVRWARGLSAIFPGCRQRPLEFIPLGDEFPSTFFPEYDPLTADEGLMVLESYCDPRGPFPSNFLRCGYHRYPFSP